MAPRYERRRPAATLLATALAMIAVSTANPPGPARASRPSQVGPSDGPILGAALTIVADGTAPFEDRPFQVTDLGVLPGVRGTADPGDDVGPRDGVVRSWDAVVYRASFSVRDAPVDDLVVEVRLDGPAVWDVGQVAALPRGGCPGGATLSADGRTVRCAVGRVVAPPAVTAAIDLTARVSGAALQGDTVSASLTVRASGAVADPDEANCPTPRPEGCDDATPAVKVSAAPAAELRKFLYGSSNSVHEGVEGRRLDWLLDVVIGADGDVRGSSALVGAPYVLPDWWRIVGPTGRDLPLRVTLVGCRDLDDRDAWTCAQPGGPGTPLAITLERLDLQQSLPNGVGAARSATVARVLVSLWVSQAEITAAGGDVTFHNCFATEVGQPTRALWAPLDAVGQPNLGGRAEPTSNNCSLFVFAVPRPVPTPRATARPPSRPPQRPPRRPAPPGRPGRPAPPVRTPTATPTVAIAMPGKRYLPVSRGAAVTDDMPFGAEVRVAVGGGGTLHGIVACDKWDNSTHILQPVSQSGAAGVRAWWQDGSGAARDVTDGGRVVIEYAAGRWGRLRPSNATLGRTWYVQATTTCSDAAVVPGMGWVTIQDVDFEDGGQAKLNARDVNMVRARFQDGVPAGSTVWIELPYKALRNRPGSWLMNYAAVASGEPSRTRWDVRECYGAQGKTTRRVCPVPAPGTKSVPGGLGDMLVHVGVPLLLQKRNDPPVPSGSPVVHAGDTAAFVLDVATFPSPSSPPPPPYPKGAFAPGVVLTDTLPLGLLYELDSATIASEDIDGDGILTGGEDRNGNGLIDSDVPFEPQIVPGPDAGETTLRWVLGHLPYERRVPSIRYVVRASRLMRGGTALTNRAGVSADRDRPPDCRPGFRDLEGGRCAWAQVIIANIAAAQVEKVPVRPLVLPGTPIAFELSLANLTSRPVEWLDAVDLLPRAGEPRAPGTRLTGGITAVRVVVAGGGAPVEIWASATDPDVLDVAGGSVRDGLVDPVAAWGGPGAGLRGADWPCRLSDVGSRSRCGAIKSGAAVTAIRVWGPDPRPNASTAAADSFLPIGGPPRRLELILEVPGSQPGDVAHNAWGGRFESLRLPIFDDAIVRVRPPDTPTPTATATTTETRVPSATPTASATPTVTPTPPPTDTPTVTPTPPPSDTPTVTPTVTPTPVYRINLPIAVRTQCEAHTVDVVLVIDVSSSMRRAAGDGGTKLDAVLRAARAFVDRFAPAPGKGRIAVVAFHNRAWVVQPLTDDRAKLDAAVDALANVVEEGTRLDLALTAGAAALADVDASRLRAMVFLTDGLPNRVPTPVTGGTMEDTVLAAAAAARGQQITIRTVGYGREDAEDIADRILPSLLIDIAGSPAGYHQTDNAAGLAEVFRRIAAALGCVGGGWP